MPKVSDGGLRKFTMRRLLVVALLATIGQAQGQITLDAKISGDQASSSSSTVATPAFSTAFGNELLLAFVATDFRSGSNTTVQSISGAGLTWALVVRTNSQKGTSEIWRAFATSPLSNVSVTATLSQQVTSSITVMSFAGVDPSGTNGSAAIGATASANSASGAPTASLVTTRNNSWVFGVGNDYDNPIARTLGTGQTLVHQYLAPVGDTYWVQMQASPTAISGTRVTINDTAPTTDRYNLSICEVLPATAEAARAWSISGTISPVTAGSGASVTLSGAATKTATADASGNFTFSGLTNGSYTVTPTKTGYTFTPASLAKTVSGANVTGANFTAQAVTWSISGTISPVAAGSGASVTLSGAAARTATADASGNFTFSGLANGSYTVTPTKTGYTFTPASLAKTVSGANVTGVNFTAQAVTWSISGTISPVAAGSGASVTLSGAATRTATADASGNFTFSGLANGSYTVTPTKTGYTFTPASLAKTVSGANVTGANFTGQQSTTSSAITLDVNISGDQASSSSSTVATPAFSTAFGNELLLAFVATDFQSGSNTTVQSISGAGLTWALVVRTNSQKGTSEIWRAFATSPLSNVSVTATLSQQVTSSITVMSFAGVDPSGTNGSGAIGATASANSSSGAPTASLVTTRNNSWVFGVGNDYDNPIARTLGTGQTLVHQYLAPVGDTYWVQMQASPTAISGTRVTINDTAPTTDRYNLSICEVLPATTEAAQVWSISGTISPVTAGTGASVTLSGAATRTATADASGNFTFGGLANGSYTVTPTKTGYTFTPASLAKTVSGANVTGVNFTASTVASTNLTVDGSVILQTMDGMGTNVNTWNWSNAGDVRTALDMLVEINGANLFRVIHDRMDWAAQNQIPALHKLDSTTLATIYETAQWTDVWNTIAYLNSKGISGNQIVLNFMGWTPTWMGGGGQYNVPSYINSSNNSDMATMIASAVYYGRQVKGLSFNLLAPFNELDWNCLEGPCLSTTQAPAIYAAIISELNTMGQTDVRLVGPDTASGDPSSYVAALMGNSTVAARMDHFSSHSYSGSALTPSYAYPGKNYWVSETSIWCSTCDGGGGVNGVRPSDEWAFARDSTNVFLGDIENGFTAVLTWEGFDSNYYHHSIATQSAWGMIGYNKSTAIYTPRKAFYTFAILNWGIRPGATKLGVTKSLGFPVQAFYNPYTGETSILGYNSSTSTATINGTLNNLPALSVFSHFQTDSGSKNLAQMPDVTVSGQTFGVQVPPSTFFLLLARP